MKIGQMILGVLLFALVTAILYVWGLKKSVGQQEDLNRNLMSACGSRVVRYLKKHGTVTETEIAKLIEGITVGQFWSRRKIKVQDGEKVAGQIIEFLVDQLYIEPSGDGGYRLKK